MYKNKKLYLFVVLSLAMLFVGCGEKMPDISIVVYDDGTIDENSIPDGRSMRRRISSLRDVRL